MNFTASRKSFGVGFVLFGVVCAVVYFFEVEPWTANELNIFARYYGLENRPPMSYEDMYFFAQRQLIIRHHTEICFWALLVGGSLLLGIVLLAWHRDRTTANRDLITIEKPPSS